jgi:hypothetical protein
MTSGRAVTAGLSLEAWVAKREPPVPDALLRHVGDAADVPDVPAEAAGALETLLSEARRALGDALVGAGERRGAFRLLAADAYVTYACEIALQSSEPLPALLGIVSVVAAAPEEG